MLVSFFYINERHDLSREKSLLGSERETVCMQISFACKESLCMRERGVVRISRGCSVGQREAGPVTGMRIKH